MCFNMISDRILLNSTDIESSYQALLLHFVLMRDVNWVKSGTQMTNVTYIGPFLKPRT